MQESIELTREILQLVRDGGNQTLEAYTRLYFISGMTGIVFGIMSLVAVYFSLNNLRKKLYQSNEGLWMFVCICTVIALLAGIMSIVINVPVVIAPDATAIQALIDQLTK